LVIFPTLSITIPNHQLVGIDWEYTTQGILSDTNSSTKVVKMRQADVGVLNAMPILGLPLLSSTYLMVDYESSTFELSAAIPTTKQQIRPYSFTNCTDSSSSTNQKNSNMSLSGGEIAGVVVGAVLGLLALGCILLYLTSSKLLPAALQRKRSNRINDTNELGGNERARNITEPVEIDSHQAVELGSEYEAGLPIPEKERREECPGDTLVFSELSGGYLPQELPGEDVISNTSAPVKNGHNDTSLTQSTAMKSQASTVSPMTSENSTMELKR
jgi:hypothetical protein